MSVQEYRRNQILLNLARSIFEEQNNLECLVTKILTEARELLKCKRCVVFLFDLDFCESVSTTNLIDLTFFFFFFNAFTCKQKFQANLVWSIIYLSYPACFFLIQPIFYFYFALNSLQHKIRKFYSYWKLFSFGDSQTIRYVENCNELKMPKLPFVVHFKHVLHLFNEQNICSFY